MANTNQNAPQAGQQAQPAQQPQHARQAQPVQQGQPVQQPYQQQYQQQPYQQQQYQRQYQQQPYQGNPQGYPAPNQNVTVVTQPANKNGLGTAGFVLALIGFFLSWVPVVGWIIWLLGAIFSIVGVFRLPRGLAIAGIVLSFIDLIILVVVVGGLAGAGMLLS
jgi:hypothetical protein